MWSVDDHRHMARALALGRLGLYTAHPNPRVGCVLVKDGAVVGEGWHRKAGEPHAEVLALRAAGRDARGASCYVTLEPCCHQGRTPPCTESLIGAGIARVILAMTDPNPAVQGRGCRALAEAGIAIATGLGEPQATRLNRGFVKRMRSGLPGVTVKTAMSLDGRVALSSGMSRWITSQAARADVQRLRAQSSAILTGIGTVLADDPLLTVRDPMLADAGVEPLRVVLDTRLRMPVSARMLREAGSTLVLCGEAGHERRVVALAEAGARVIEIPMGGGRLDLTQVLQILAGLEVNEVLVEAGPALTGTMLAAGLVDELVAYVAPRLLGGDAMPMAALGGYSRLEDALHLEITDVRAIGSDWRITARPVSG
ncbi:MAG: bifunctional diaminohydroxyphosphoribosylaminopyrimidine deaminase/5-amino-6-(5-phosphoribosylamino)uracil reductase RibD [Gammaproteobacteria bacterium]